MKIYTAPPESWEQIHLIHETIYKYVQPVRFTPHRLVLRPREGHDMRLNSMDLKTYPECTIKWHRDMLDNSIAIAEFDEPSDELRIVSGFTVSVPPEDPQGQSPVFVPYPSSVAGIEQMVAMPYLQFIYPPQVEGLRKWFSSTGLTAKYGQKAAIFDDMAMLIYNTIKYTRREVVGVQSPEETLRLGSGSCRDMAVLMMETARSLGYPARFVSGYMESGNSAVGRGSTHAWTEIYLPEYGWTGFDPSIGRKIGSGHIAVGVSHHPRGVMPVSGGFSGPSGGGTSLKVRISTERLPPPDINHG